MSWDEITRAQHCRRHATRAGRTNVKAGSWKSSVEELEEIDRITARLVKKKPGSRRERRVEALGRPQLILPVPLAVIGGFYPLPHLGRGNGEHLFRYRSQLCAGRHRALLDFAGFDQPPDQEKRFADCPADAEQSVIPHEKQMFFAKVTKNSGNFLFLLGETFKIVIPDLAGDMTPGLVQHDQFALRGGDHDAGCRMDVKHAVHVRPIGHDSTMEIQARGRQAYIRVADNPAIGVNLHERGRRYLIPPQADGIHQEAIWLPRHPGGDVVVDIAVPSLMKRHSERRRQVNARLPFFWRDILLQPYRGKFLNGKIMHILFSYSQVFIVHSKRGKILARNHTENPCTLSLIKVPRQPRLAGHRRSAAGTAAPARNSRSCRSPAAPPGL